MGLKKVSNATKRVKGSKGFGKGIAKQKQIGRIQRSKAQRDERSVKADAAAKTRTPLLERTDRDAETTTKAKKGKGGKAPGFEAGMNVDDFLEGGFEKAMAEEDDDDEEEAPKPKAKAKAKVPKEDHKTQLSKLKQQDPAFYEYLQKTDKSLLSVRRRPASPATDRTPLAHTLPARKKRKLPLPTAHAGKSSNRNLTNYELAATPHTRARAPPPRDARGLPAALTLCG